jgi:putative transposase
MQSGTIGYDKIKKKLKVNLCFQAPDILFNNGDRIVGVDRGLYNVVSLSDGQLYNAKQIRKKKREFLYVKRQLQEKGTRPAKRKLKARSGRGKRFSLHTNHCISKWLAHQPYDVVVLEDLSGIRKQRKGKIVNQWLSNWTFYQLEQLLSYKAAALGKQVVKTDARYTSQKCFACGKIEKKNRNKSQYKCSCGYSEHADINAAKNIKSNYLLSVAERKTEQAAVNQPNVSIAMLDAKPTTSIVG